MKKRILSAVVILFLLLLFSLLRILEISVFDFMLLAISMIGTYEVSNCNTKSGRHNYLYVELFFVISVYLGLTISFAYRLEFIYSILIILGCAILSIIFMAVLPLLQKYEIKEEFLILPEEKKKSYVIGNSDGAVPKKYILDRYITTLKILMYPCAILIPLYYLNNITRLSLSSIDGYVDLGWFLLASLFSISMATDTFAFFIGIIFKGPKLAPTISPKKTISGAIGGFVFGTASSVCLYLIFNSFSAYNMLFSAINLELIHCAMIGALGSIFNQIGDLYESKAKRILQVKDFGNLFPGHGGIMDRVDGLSFVGVILFVIYMIALT